MDCIVAVRLGEAENARRHICFSGQCPDQADLQRLQTLDKHLRRCWEARKIGDWKTAIKETDAAIANGADSSPQVITDHCRKIGRGVAFSCKGFELTVRFFRLDSL